MHYSYPKFNRASELRTEVKLNKNSDLVLILDKDLFFFDPHENLYNSMWYTIDSLKLISKQLIFLGIDDGKQLWATQLNNVVNKNDLQQNAVAYKVRDVFKYVNDKDKALLTYAFGLIKWNNRTNYCGVCSAEMTTHDFGHSKTCNNETCKTILYPQISPAIIALVEHKQKNGMSKCLLQTRHYQGKTMCSTFAGFVEIGESLEDAVIRELKEEVCVDVTRTQYVSSQPWSFTSSLMIGYYAQVENESYHVDGIEVKSARWFTANELKDLSEKNEIQLSLPDSISRYLIETWINDN